VKGPLITVRCECGADEKLRYGERWTCPACGRSYDTSRIPEEEYRRIARATSRLRAGDYVFAAALAVLMLVLLLYGEPIQILIALPFLMIAWLTYGRPLLRRRYRRLVAERPTWDLSAEP
jgi:hypothetical protein